MRKKTDKKLGRFFFVLAIVSGLITLLEGLFYYSAEAYPSSMFRWMLIFQNTIKAFGFRPEISLKEMSRVVAESTSMLERTVGIAYSFAVFAAPYCTLAVVYKFLERVLRFQSIFWLFSRKRRIIVFGYNEDVKVLLAKDYEGYRVHLVSSDISKDEEVELLRKGIALHRVDMTKLGKEQLDYFLKRMEASKAQNIILFEDSSTKNFSLYRLFHQKDVWKILKQEVKFICRCEDAGISRIIEDFHDNFQLEQDKGGTKAAGQQSKRALDLEIVSVPELRVRKMLQDNPLHSYYEGTRAEPKDKRLHMLIIGFGRLGQQLLLQSMNLGVVSSENEILIDVVDYDMKNKMSRFANHFNEDYVDISENEISIPSTKADGSLKIRFHQMDISYKKFFELLKECGNPDSKENGLFTYIAICIRNADVSLHCMTEVERYLRCFAKEEADRKARLGVRMESNRQMAEYLRNNNTTFENVFIIEETESTIGLKELLDENLNWEAKEYNYIYSKLGFEGENNSEEPEELPAKGTEKYKAAINKKWREMKLFRRNSNRAVALHTKIKKELMDSMGIDLGTLKQYFGEQGELLIEDGNAWVIPNKDEDKLRKHQNDPVNYPFVYEASRLEHRRWCYFMASIGWKRTLDLDEKKNEELKETPCLCTWKDLVNHKSNGTCKYDLMPVLMEYKLLQSELLNGDTE